MAKTYSATSDILVFPSVNSVRLGKLTSEENLVTPVTRITNLNYKLSEEDFMLAISGTTVTIGSGIANINGYYVHMSQAIEITVSNDKYVCLVLDRTASGTLKGDNDITLDSQTNQQMYQGVFAGALTKNNNGTYTFEGVTYQPEDVFALAQVVNGALVLSEDSALRIDDSTIRVDKHYPESGYTSLHNYLGEMHDRYVPQYGSSAIKSLTFDGESYTYGEYNIFEFDTENLQFITSDEYGNSVSNGIGVIVGTTVASGNDTMQIGIGDSKALLKFRDAGLEFDDLSLTASSGDCDVTLGSTFDVSFNNTSALNITPGSKSVFSTNIESSKGIKSSGRLIGTEVDVSESGGLVFYSSVGYNNNNEEYTVTVGNNPKIYLNAGIVTCTGDFTATRVFNAVYNDLAEFYEKDDPEEKFKPGDVIVINPETGKCKKSTEVCSTMVVGVYSDTWGQCMGGERVGLEDNLKKYVPVGLSGRVIVSVDGYIRAGDLLVSGKDGKAKSAEMYVPGTVIGKALGPSNNGKVWMQIMLA